MNQYDFTQHIEAIGEAGLHMTQIGAAEGAAGNISVFVRDLEDLDRNFIQQAVIPLPVKALSLAGGWVLVSGSGQRLRDLATRPETSLCALHIDVEGETAELFSGVKQRPTVELNSHLAIHTDQVGTYDLDFHAVVHVQPVYLVYLTHIERYTEFNFLNRRLFRWQPETIVLFPEGIQIIPFQILGSVDQMEATRSAMDRHKLVVWQAHGTVSRSDESVQKAGDLVEYAETAAHYEVLNLQAGEPTQGLADEQLRHLCNELGVTQKFFD